MNMNTNDTKERLLQELEKTAQGVGKILDDLNKELTKDSKEFANIGNEKLEELRRRWREIEDKTKSQAKVAVASAENYVHKNPFSTVGYAFGAGMTVGAVLTALICHQHK